MSRDAHLLALHPFRGIAIITAAQFVAQSEIAGPNKRETGSDA